MNVISRRDFHQQISGSLLTWSLLDTLFSRDAFADDVRLLASKWLENVNAISLDLKGGKLDQATWQKQVDQLLGKVDLPDLLKFLDFDKLTRDLEMPERGELSLRPTLPKVTWRDASRSTRRRGSRFSSGAARVVDFRAGKSVLPIRSAAMLRRGG